jgi:alpha-maltose-1-phosphate synthase
VRAIRHLDPGINVVLAAGQPDTMEIGEEMEAGVAAAQAGQGGVTWIPEMLDLRTKVQLYSHAAVFCCPSVYEPFGIINLEAMACGTAVVASDVGGIPEVVVDGQTGLLVPLELRADEPMAPADPDGYARGLAAAINELVADPERRAAMGEAGRQRAVERFSWRAIAEQTVALYRRLTPAG